MDVFRNLIKERLAAGEVPQAEHLSPDVLSAFGERTLPGAQRGHALSHLALCPTCRATLSLGVPETMPAADATVSRPRVSIWQFPGALRWGSAAAALFVAMSVGLLVEHHNVVSRENSAKVVAPNVTEEATAARQESKAQESGATVAQNLASQMAPVSHAKARTRHEGRTTPHFASSGVVAGTAIGGPVFRSDNLVSARNDGPRITAMQAPLPPGETETHAKANVTAGSVNHMTPLPSASDTPVEDSQHHAGAQNAGLASKPVSAYGLSAVPGTAKSQTGSIARWAVSSSGQLLRNTPGGALANIEPAPGVAFHAVAADGIEVWAGGAERNSNDVLSEGRGVLFHSSDAGETWRQAEGPWKRVVSRVTLDGPAVITVTSNDGKWKSSDGGQSWTAVQ